MQQALCNKLSRKEETMKTIGILLTVFLALWLVSAASVLATPPDTLGVKAPASEDDTIGYDLVIIDPSFERWYLTNQRPDGFYSLEYLENWNRLLVSQWNMLITRPYRPGCMPGNYLHYDPGISYGITLNHKLFYYFRYMQQRCRIFDQFPGSWRN